jgi:hypothetical protein
MPESKDIELYSCAEPGSRPAERVSIGIRHIDGARTIAGIDVGEDYLDLAIIDPGCATLVYRRVALAGIDRDPLGAMRERIAAAAPELGSGALAIVDSPRWPRDRALDDNRARAANRGRDIDFALRRLMAVLGASWPALGRLSMYPTPPLAYFIACIADARCKAHLLALGRALFAAHQRRGQRPAGADAPVRGGMLFTRFMIAGFAAYRALDTTGVEVSESFPDLQFRLAAPTRRLIAKSAGGQALAMRQRIVRRLSCRIEIEAGAPPSLDFADAAIMALGARSTVHSGAMVELRSPAEGNFVLALSPRQAAAACLAGALAVAGATKNVIICGRRLKLDG